MGGLKARPSGTARMLAYADDVEDGRVLACDALTKAVARFRADWKAARKKGARYSYDAAAADKIVRNIERLRQWENPFAGQPIVLEGWECFFICQLFGWRNKKTGIRRFKKALLFMARKQGKTILVSTLALVSLKNETGIEIYTLAQRQKTANKTFKNITEFLRRSPVVAKDLEVHKSPKAIEHPAAATSYMPLSSDSSLDGLNPYIAIIDELAAQKNGEAYDTLTSGMGTHPERLTILISTAAASLSNPLIEEYSYAKRVLDGSSEDDEYLIAIYEYDKEDRWDDLGKLQKSCPNLGVSVELDYFAGELKLAKMIPSKATEYKTKYCNLWQNSVDTWIPDALWARCRKAATHKAALTREVLAKAPCYIALDYSSIWDWTALTRYYYIRGLDRYVAYHRFYIPSDQLDTKAHIETPALRSWVEQKLVTATPGECVDYSYLYRDLEADLKDNKVLGVVYDSARVRDFEIVFGSRCTIIPFSQKVANMSPAAKAWEKAIVDGKIIDDSPVLRWMVSCAINKTYADSGRYQITKNGTGKYARRIDGVITSIMAYGVLETYVLELNKPKPKLFDITKISY